MLQKLKEEREMEASAVKIQSVYRGKKARNSVKEEKNKFAITVQRYLRGYLGYK